MSESLSELALRILHPVTFIDNDVLPFEFTKRRFIIEDVFISGQDDIELVILQLLSNQGPLIALASVSDDLNRWAPFLEFIHPVVDSR